MLPTEQENEYGELIERMRKGEQAAFEELFNKCAPHITFVCKKICDNKQDVEEVVQDTFLAAFKNAGELRAETLMAYLRKIAVNACYQKKKKNKRQPSQVPIFDTDQEDESFVEQDESFLPHEYLENKEKRAELLCVISSLPRRQQEMIYLYYYAEVNSVEIAELLGCTPGNVRNTLHAARSTIKKKLLGSNYAPEGTTGASLAAVLLFEGHAFAEILGIAPVAIATEAGVASAVGASTISSSTIYAIIACICVATVVGVGAFFTFFYSDSNEYDPPTYTTYTTQSPQIPKDTEEYQTSYIPTEPPDTESPPDEPPCEPAETDSPLPPLPPPPELPITPEPIDRTAEILAALAAANNIDDINGIVSYFDFVPVREMRSSDDQLFRFYAVDHGRGDILIGIMSNEDSNEWRMEYELFNESPRPMEMLQFLQWMGV